MKPRAIPNLTAAKECHTDEYLFLIGVTQAPAGSDPSKLSEELEGSSKIASSFQRVEIKNTQTVTMAGFTFKEITCTVDANGGMILRNGLIGSRIYSVAICSKREIDSGHPIVDKFFRSVCINQLPEPQPSPQIPVIASGAPVIPTPDTVGRTPPATTPASMPSVPDIWVVKKWKELGLSIFLPSKVEFTGVKLNLPNRNYYTAFTIFFEGKFTYKLNAERYPSGFPDPRMSKIDLYIKQEVLKMLGKDDEYELVDVKMPGATAKDFSMKKNGIATLKRIVIRGNQRVILTVEKWGSDIDAKTPEVMKYFDSLELE